MISIIILPGRFPRDLFQKTQGVALGFLLSGLQPDYKNSVKVEFVKIYIYFVIKMIGYE